MTAQPRPRPKVVSLTDAAAARLKEIMTAAEEGFIGVRVGVKNAGCAGMEYTMDYVAEKGEHDEVVEDQGVTIFIDPAAILFLLGSTVDYQVDKLAAKFVFDNPNQTDACGCGESVTIIPAKLRTDDPSN